MTLRALLRGSLLYTIGNFLPRIGAFLMLPIYTASMGPEQFGIFSLMLSVSGVLGVLLRFGMDGALMRLHFDVEERDRPTLYSTLAVATAVGGLAIALLFGAGAAPFFESLFAGTPFWPLGPITLLLTFLLAFQYVPFTFLRATQRPGRFLALTLASFGVGLAATVLLVGVLDLGAAGALFGQAAGAGTVALAAVVILGRLGASRPRPALLRRSLDFGLPLVPHALSGWILNLSDRWLIGLLAPGGVAAAQAAIGVYTLGYLLGQVVSVVAYSFNAAWVPFFYERGETATGRRLLREVATLSAIVLSVLAVGVGLLAPELTAALGRDRWGDATSEAARITPVVAFASTVHGLYFMVVSAVFLARRTRVLPILTAAAGVTNVAVNILLIPRIGIMGAAWATLVGYSVLAMVTTWYAALVFPLELDAARLGLILGLTAVVLAGGSTATAGLAGTWGGAGVHVVITLGFAAAAAAIGAAPYARLRTLLIGGPSATDG